MVKLLLKILSILFFIVAHLPKVDAQTDEIRVKLDFDLCPEYQFGGVQVKPFYKIEDNNQEIPPTVVSENIDTSRNTYTATILLPRNLGSKNLYAYGKCQSSKGISKESNSIKVSNCDFLAKFDTDGDGLTDNQEDTNCDNSFSPGDISNLNNVDTDGDGVRDLVEIMSGTTPSDPASSPRPYIYSASSFDPDNNSISNPVVFRSQTGSWFIKSDSDSNPNSSFVFGTQGDLPFTYRDSNQNSNVGVVRKNGLELQWQFRGKGFNTTNGDLNTVSFGIFGDNIILGPWEKPGITNPAVARLYNGIWYFYILKSDLTVKSLTWGGNGDIPKPQDLDGDRIFDVSVFRPSTSRTYSILSLSGGVEINDFGSGTSDHTVRGDFTGDGIEDISFWEPLKGHFYSMKSDVSFDSQKASQKDPQHYKEINLGEYFFDLPISWNRTGNLNLYTVINHSTGIRKYYLLNNPNSQLRSIQWGIFGDHQG